jgi:hypothetical protein
MRRNRRWTVLGVGASVLLLIPAGFWFSITHRPRFYRERASLPKPVRQAESKRFMEQSLQLYNDIVNEPRWQASFTDQEVNAWLSEDLVEHFADMIPSGVHEPMVAFEMDRAILAFEMDRGPIRSVITVVARVRVPEGNVLALTLEKINAGVLPVPPDQLIDKINEQAQLRGLNIRWEKDGNLPMALLRYTPDQKRRDVVLERIQIVNGQILLAGRSQRARGGASASINLPKRRVLQSTFPRRKDQTSASLPVSALDRFSSATPQT